MNRYINGRAPGLSAWPAVAILVALPFSVASAGAHRQAPDQLEDDAWITLEGSVSAVSDDEFRLQYGPHSIEVEFDDDDRDAASYMLNEGDKVIVTGRVDDDFFEEAEIEAHTVFVESAGTTFFSNDAAGEDARKHSVVYNAWLPVKDFRTVVTGTVTEVNGDDFTVFTGSKNLEVDVDELGYDPFDDEGYQKIEVGDRVQVTGEIDEDFFFRRELEAKSVIELN